MPRYLIDFKNDITSTQIEEYLTIHNCEVLKNFENLKNVYHVDSEVEPPKTEIVDIVILDDHTKCKLLDVVPIPPAPYDSMLQVEVAKDENWWKVFSMNDLDFTKSTVEIPVYGKNVIIYLVDSGIDHAHPEFVGKDVQLLHSFTTNFTDTTGHGTALASLMVGKTCGMTAATVKVVKLFETNTPTYQSDILYAFNAIMSDYLASNNTAAIVNLSWGIQKNEYIEQKIRNLIQTGVIVVAAAGNNGTPIGDVTPASMPEVVTIGAYNSNFVPCDFSNYTGPNDTSLTTSAVNHGELDSWAPGEQIYCALPERIDPTTGTVIRPAGYGFTNGTSSAAAIYSASLAYNISQMLTSDLSMLPHYSQDGITKLSVVTAGDRVGLLNLSDPKYANSFNKICTFFNYKNRPNADRNITMPIKVVSRTAETQHVALFILSNTSSYELLTALPPGAQMINNFLYYNPTTEVTDPSGVEVTSVNYRVTKTDSNSYTNIVNLVHVHTDFNAEQLPPDDPIIDIVAMDTCAGTTPGYCYNAGCLVAGQYCGTYSDGKNSFCDCRL